MHWATCDSLSQSGSHILKSKPCWLARVHVLDKIFLLFVKDHHIMLEFPIIQELYYWSELNENK